MGVGRAWAPSNIALVKYWGKRDAELNLPAMGSLSVSLRGLITQTMARFEEEPGSTTVLVDGSLVGAAGLARVERMLRRIRQQTGVQGRAVIESQTNFPVGAGIASSASGMAAVAWALCAAAGWEASKDDVSRIARLGSGSACRSIYPGFVEWMKGEADDGNDSFGTMIATPEHWPLDVLVVVVDDGPKKVSSTSGMQSSAVSSAFYDAWVTAGEADLEGARKAVLAKDFDALAMLTESSTLKMHATMMTGAPSLLYWRPGTIQVLECVEEMKREHIPCFFTMDAGPNVKLFFPPGESQKHVERLEALDEVKTVLVSSVGPGATLQSEGTP